MWQRSVYLQITCLRAFCPFKKETICSSLCYNSEQLQTCLPFLVHTTTGGCTYIITFLLVSCISKQKLDLGKKNTQIKTCELAIPFNTFTIARGIQNTGLPVWYNAKVSIQTLVASGVVCACPIATISWLMMTSCSVLVSKSSISNLWLPVTKDALLDLTCVER